MSYNSTKKVKAYVNIEGIVQGVGFRPFVFRLATELALDGFVRNRGGTVEILVTGDIQRIDHFISRLRSEAPPLSEIATMGVQINDVLETESYVSFTIADSEQAIASGVQVPPDIATCPDCLEELFSPDNRRYRYPFLNCINCGPRFTIIFDLPYDRAQTSMRCFPMCTSCESEYKDPLNRRFHAQPNACARCGPTLAFYDPRTDEPTFEFAGRNNENELAKAVRCLSEGSIIAIKGLGGFHLVCDATNCNAVTRLRTRKERPAKPFALMMPDIEALETYCFVSGQESQILTGPLRPIVLLKRREKKDEGAGQSMDKRDNGGNNRGGDLSPLIAPSTDLLGVMLPYTPLQHLLLNDFRKPLVMTSANISEEPICAGNREAVSRLGTIADAYLFNNRDISSRYDDTVTRVVGARERVVRRARGYAPKPIDLPFRARIPVLAMGGHLKNTFCLIQDDKAYLSQHIGDLDMLETVDQFERTLACFLKLFRINPEIVATDLHPDYASTRLVNQWISGHQPAPFDISKITHRVSVQHHFAHIVSCMAENGLNGSVIGIAFDGIGYGADDKLWGGEFLQCSYETFQRLACLKNVRMPGGVKTIREPWRMALSYLSGCNSSPEAIESIKQRLIQSHGEQSVSIVFSKLAYSLTSPETSSCGRLFDGVASLLGLCDNAMYEGQAAIILESEANLFDNHTILPSYSWQSTTKKQEVGDLIEIDTSAIIDGIISDLSEKRSAPFIAARFHETIAQMICSICIRIRDERKLNTVCCSGGVFQNERLLSRATSLLTDYGFAIYSNSSVPANDGGLSLGQAVAALAKVGALGKI